jgi:hypothetical protein
MVTWEWVLLHYFPHEPVQVYGMFPSADEAFAYAEKQGFAIAPGAFTVKRIINVNEEDA